MEKTLFFSLILVLVSFGMVSPLFALDKVKLGSSIRLTPDFYLPPLAAEEKGFWKENGLDVEWVPFAGGTPHFIAVAAREINIGLASAPDPVLAAERGNLVFIVAEVVPDRPFYIWVKGDSPYRDLRDLKGKRVGVTVLGAVTHALGRVVFKAHGMEKDVRFVGAGGVPAQRAGLLAGSWEAIVDALTPVVDQYLDGTMRYLARTADYVPKPWVDVVIFSRKDFARSNPEVVRRLLRASLQSFDFIRKNPRWTMDKMKSFQGVSEAGAKHLYDSYRWSVTGRLERKAIENLRGTFVEYGVITEKAPPVDELYTNEYLS